MACLLIEELCIGDWVKLKTTEEEYRIEEILRGGVVRLEGNRHLQSVDNIEPITLSTDIMRANGFECIEVGDKGAATPKQHYMRYEKWRGETQWGYRELFYDRMTQMWRFGGMNEYRFKEVHKLQHAIRFSGWNKIIEL